MAWMVAYSMIGEFSAIYFIIDFDFDSSRKCFPSKMVKVFSLDLHG